MVKIIHTADWHIGQMLHGFERGNEHRDFLKFLLETMKSEEADALVVAGDIFDSSNPSAESQKLAYDFLSELREEMPHADIILTGGNHDSWSRLDAPGALFRSIGVTMIGRLRTKPDGTTDCAAMAVPIHDRKGDVALYAAAVPFIRVADIGCGTEDLTQDLVVSRIGGIYRDMLDYIKTLPSTTGKALALGHCYMVNGLLSELSERKVLCGNQHALPVSVFDGYDFAALGHLHRDQSITPNIVYSGSPLALSMDEGALPTITAWWSLSATATASGWITASRCRLPSGCTGCPPSPSSRAQWRRASGSLPRSSPSSLTFRRGRSLRFLFSSRLRSRGSRASLPALSGAG